MYNNTYPSHVTVGITGNHGLFNIGIGRLILRKYYDILFSKPFSIFHMMIIMLCFGAYPVAIASADDVMDEAAMAAGGCSCEATTLTVDGRRRMYRVCAPEASDTQLPLIVYLHDGLGSAADSCSRSRWHELGTEKGFITVYGQGCDSGEEECVKSRHNGWNNEAVDSERAVDDVAYVRAVVTHVSTQKKVDPTRIHAVGLGQGADMALLLACRASDLFAAVAPINGAPKFVECAASNQLQVFPVNGEKDDIAPWQGCCAARLKGRSPHYVNGCSAFQTCGGGVEWSPPVLTGDHPVAMMLGFDDLSGLEGVARSVCGSGFAGFTPRDCPGGIPPDAGTCYGVETCGMGPGPFHGEILGLRVAKGRHGLQSLDRSFDLRAYLLERLENARKALFSIACNDTIEDVYGTPIETALGVPDGTVLRCAPLSRLTAEVLTQQLVAQGYNVPVHTGPHRCR
jgi:poly(3-hydroxybutyrate) depolymerase